MTGPSLHESSARVQSALRRKCRREIPDTATAPTTSAARQRGPILQRFDRGRKDRIEIVQRSPQEGVTWPRNRSTIANRCPFDADLPTGDKQQEAHQLEGPGETPRQLTANLGRLGVWVSFVVILYQTVVELYDCLPAGPVLRTHFYAIFNYTLQPTGNS